MVDLSSKHVLIDMTRVYDVVLILLLGDKPLVYKLVSLKKGAVISPSEGWCVVAVADLCSWLQCV